MDADVEFMIECDLEDIKDAERFALSVANDRPTTMARMQRAARVRCGGCPDDIEEAVSHLVCIGALDRDGCHLMEYGRRLKDASREVVRE